MKRVLLLAFFVAVCSGQQSSLTGSSAARGWWDVSAEQQTNEGRTFHLVGHAQMSGTDIKFRADRIDYDEDKAVVHLSGNVTIETKKKGTLRADEADYDVTSGDLRLRLKLATAQESLTPGRPTPQHTLEQLMKRKFPPEIWTYQN